VQLKGVPWRPAPPDPRVLAHRAVSRARHVAQDAVEGATEAEERQRLALPHGHCAARRRQLAHATRQEELRPLPVGLVGDNEPRWEQTGGGVTCPCARGADAVAGAAAAAATVLRGSAALGEAVHEVEGLCGLRSGRRAEVGHGVVGAQAQEQRWEQARRLLEVHAPPSMRRAAPRLHLGSAEKQRIKNGADGKAN